MSLHDQPEWGRIYTHPNEEFDLGAVTDEVVGVVRKGLEEHPDIGAVVLECTDLPPYSARIRDELDIPVFDINTMISAVAMALNESKMCCSIWSHPLPYMGQDRQSLHGQWLSVLPFLRVRYNSAAFPLIEKQAYFGIFKTILPQGTAGRCGR